MAIRMQMRVKELQKYWQKQGVPRGLHVRMGVTTGYCTVGNFGSEQRLDYTVLGSPVNLAARLQAMAEPDHILIDETTHSLVSEYIDCHEIDQIMPKGFVRPVKIYQVQDFRSEEHISQRQRLYLAGDRVEVNIIDSSDIRAAIEELRLIQLDFEQRLNQD
jgi:class 3 adenylate cyclase